MKMTMRHVGVASLILILAQVASADLKTQTQVRSSKEIETSCRIKAKEIAAETYRGCVSEQKNSQIEQIKKEYQTKLQILKNHYEAELKKMSGKANSAPAAEAAPAKSVSEPKAATATATVTLVPAAKVETDDSTMDIPEPIPVDMSGI